MNDQLNAPNLNGAASCTYQRGGADGHAWQWVQGLAQGGPAEGEGGALKGCSSAGRHGKTRRRHTLFSPFSVQARHVRSTRTARAGTSHVREGLPPGTGAGAGAGPGVAPAVMGDVGRAVDRDLKLATRGLTPIRGPASCKGRRAEGGGVCITTGEPQSRLPGDELQSPAPLRCCRTDAQGALPVGGLASCGIVWDRARGEPARGLPAPPALRGEAPRTEPRLDDEMEELGRYTTGGDMSRGVLQAPRHRDRRGLGVGRRGVRAQGAWGAKRRRRAAPSPTTESVQLCTAFPPDPGPSHTLGCTFRTSARRRAACSHPPAGVTWVGTPCPVRQPCRSTHAWRSTAAGCPR